MGSVWWLLVPEIQRPPILQVLADHLHVSWPLRQPPRLGRFLNGEHAPLAWRYAGHPWALQKPTVAWHNQPGADVFDPVWATILPPDNRARHFDYAVCSSPFWFGPCRGSGSTCRTQCFRQRICHRFRRRTGRGFWEEGRHSPVPRGVFPDQPSRNQARQFSCIGWRGLLYRPEAIAPTGD